MKLLIVFILLHAFQAILAQQSDVVADEEKQSNYNYFLQNPLQINQVTADELSALGILNSAQIANFITHRSQIHHFESIYELQTIHGWELALLKKIKPLSSIYYDSSLLTRIQGSGVKESNLYLGSRNPLYYPLY